MGKFTTKAQVHLLNTIEILKVLQIPRILRVGSLQVTQVFLKRIRGTYVSLIELRMLLKCQMVQCLPQNMLKIS